MRVRLTIRIEGERLSKEMEKAIDALLDKENVEQVWVDQEDGYSWICFREEAATRLPTEGAEVVRKGLGRREQARVAVEDPTTEEEVGGGKIRRKGVQMGWSAQDGAAERCARQARSRKVLAFKDDPEPA